MVITKRDLELFRKLSDYGMLSTKQIGEIFFFGVALTTVLRRLRMLESNFYLRRIEGLLSHELLWVLASKGAIASDTNIPKRHWCKNMLDHDYKLLSLRLRLEGCGVAHSWTPEHEIRSAIFRKYGIREAKNRLIPDGLMGIEVDGKKQTIAIEVELTMKNLSKLKTTLSRYKGTRDTFAVWYIVPSKAILQQVFKAWNNCGGNYSGIKIFGSYLNELMDNPLMTALRGDQNPKTIGESWRALPAQVSAQRVSTQNDLKIENKMEVTEENHAPILEIAC
jgi:hypothetical protein